MRAVQTYCCRFVDALPRFWRERRGNVALIFALAVIPLLGFIGAAVDYSRASAIKIRLQSALDATALMVSKTAATMTSDQIQSTAKSYFLAEFNESQVDNVNFTAAYSTSGGSNVVVNGSADMPTDFIKIMGLDKITVTGSATAKWGSTRLRVALVLDNTGSMADNGKMTALKTATNNLITQLKSSVTTAGDVYVSIVPFSKDVNVGPYQSSWTDWLDTTAPSNSTPDAGVGPGSSCPYSSQSNGFTCVIQPGGSRTTSTIPSSGSYAGYICPSNSIGCYDSTNPTNKTVSSCNGLQSCSCSGGYHYYGGSQVCTQTTYTHTWHELDSKTGTSYWNGCITDRGTDSGPAAVPDNSTDYDQSVWSPDTTKKASLYPPENQDYVYCPSQMLELSYDWSTMNTVVNNMYPNGSTNQPIGLVWGWLSLVGGGPLSAPALDPNYKYEQVIILLSDGLNTQDRWYGNGYNTSTQVDNRMYDASNNGTGTCANFKNASTDDVKNIIYTIQVDTGGDPTSTLLQNCASDPSKFYLLTSADQIIAAFNQIGTQLSDLRLSK
jgi:Flp pilus assembly protein TadG